MRYGLRAGACGACLGVFHAPGDFHARLPAVGRYSPVVFVPLHPDACQHERGGFEDLFQGGLGACHSGFLRLLFPLQPRRGPAGPLLLAIKMHGVIRAA